MSSISRLYRLLSRLIVYIGQKQRVGIFAGQMLVDYRDCQVDYTMKRWITLDKNTRNQKLSNS